MNIWLAILSFVLLMVLPQRATVLSVAGHLVDQSGQPVVGVRIAADGADGNGVAISESSGAFVLPLSSAVQLGQQVRIRTVDPKKRFLPFVQSIAVSDPPIPLRIELKRVATPRQQSPGQLTLVIERMELTRRTGVMIQTKSFTVNDLAATSRIAADWVRATLRASFPASEESLTISVELQPSSSNPVLISPADPLREDRLWMFSQGSKIGHPRIIKAPEAEAEAVDNASKYGGSVVVHFDRPGYELGMAVLHRSGTQQVVLKRLDPPALTIVVNVEGHDLLGRRLRVDLSDRNLAVHDAAELASLVKPYEQSLVPYLSVGQRLNLLRQARVDVFVAGVYSASSP